MKKRLLYSRTFQSKKKGTRPFSKRVSFPGNTDRPATSVIDISVPLPPPRPPEQPSKLSKLVIKAKKDYGLQSAILEQRSLRPLSKRDLKARKNLELSSIPKGSSSGPTTI